MKSIENRLNRVIDDFYREFHISPNSEQLVALSGGCDSMALLYLLHRKCPRLKAAYFNHNLRDKEELSREIDLLHTTTDNLKIPFFIGEVPRGTLKEQVTNLGLSLEDAARRERYRFLNSLMEKEKIDYLVLGHHANDQTETILSRFFQGSGPAGLSGISPINGNKIRPLLSITKNDLIMFLKEKHIAWSEDSSNGKELFQRNQIRHILLPVLKKYFPGLDGSLSLLSEKMKRIDHFLEGEASQISWNEDGHSQFSINLEEFLSYDPVLREYSLWKILDLLLKGSFISGGRGRRIPYRFIRPLLNRQLKPNFHLNGYGLSIFVRDKKLFLEREGREDKWNSFFFLERGKNYFFYPWNVEWGKIARPVGKSVVLLLEKEEVPQIRSEGKKLFFDSHLGNNLARWNGTDWHIKKRNLGNPSDYGIIIREQKQNE